MRKVVPVLSPEERSNDSLENCHPQRERENAPRPTTGLLPSLLTQMDKIGKIREKIVNSFDA